MRTTVADLTAPARIRRAAIVLFGREGFGVGLRAIADEAGVSLGLIRHHFGSKEELLSACDAHVIAEIRRLQDEQLDTEDMAATAIDNLAAADEYQPLLMYVLQALRSGGELARSFIEHAIDTTVDYLDRAEKQGEIKPSMDQYARARWLVMQKLGTMLLEFSLADDGSDPMVVWRRWIETNTLPALEVFTEGFFTDRRMLDAYLDYVKDPPSSVVE